MTTTAGSNDLNLMSGNIPEYVPPHLRGKVWDFKDEADGSVSFAHPEAYVGLPFDKSRVTLSGDQHAETFDPAHRLMNFGKSMRNQYAPLERNPLVDRARRTNESIAGALRKAIDFGFSDSGKAVGSVGLLSALGGGAGSYLLGRKFGYDVSPGQALLAALLVGGMGAAGTAWGQSKHQRRENYLRKTASTGVTAALIRSVENDSTLSNQEKFMVLRALSRASDNDREQLNRFLRTSTGAGAGVIIARFLGAKGLLPLLVGGIVGGMIGGRRPGLLRNAQGQVSIDNYF
jgi:hypothetical protein